VETLTDVQPKSGHDRFEPDRKCLLGAGDNRSGTALGRVRGFLVSTLVLFAGCSEASGPKQPLSGENLYERHCARCHGHDGRGVASQPGIPNLSDPLFHASVGDEALRGIIAAGKPPRMPGFREQLMAPSLSLVAAYVRSLRANGAPPPPPPPSQAAATEHAQVDPSTTAMPTQVTKP
jgi:mono/diheme cytochrome c family protein